MAERTVTVFGSSLGEPGDVQYDEAVELGRKLAKAGYAVATGGYDGTMVAVSEGADAAGGSITGVTAPDVFPHREVPNRFVQEHIRAASLTERIHELVDISDACIALPGSIGTFTELMVAWNLAFVARFSDSPPNPVIAVGPMWAELINHLGAQLGTETSLVTCVGTVQEAVDEVTRRVPTS
ncbi:MAG: LOG family protein [Acidimicrobiia bacterium]|nr:LOG family protein [Acidimicrobiia bacterium]